MLRSLCLLSAAVVASFGFSGCAQPPVEHTVRKVAPEDVQRDTAKAVDTVTKAATQAKENLETRLTSSLADMDAEITKLQEKGLALKDEAKARWNEKMADLKTKQEAARKKAEDLGNSTGEAWERLEEGAQAAWDDVQKAFQEASKEF
jgi:predicted  nucleic acid-binding Zn-ribbon protein